VSGCADHSFQRRRRTVRDRIRVPLQERRECTVQISSEASQALNPVINSLTGWECGQVRNLTERLARIGNHRLDDAADDGADDGAANGTNTGPHDDVPGHAQEAPSALLALYARLVSGREQKRRQYLTVGCRGQVGQVFTAAAAGTGS
jgi:hypothetical protein